MGKKRRKSGFERVRLVLAVVVSDDAPLHRVETALHVMWDPARREVVLPVELKQVGDIVGHIDRMASTAGIPFGDRLPQRDGWMPPGWSE
jgi:hypothetical protein